MAFKSLIICTLIVVSANANFVFQHATFPEFKMPPMPPMPTMPPMPKFTFAPIVMPPMPKMPSMEEIMEKSKTDPNTNYNSVVVKSSSSTTTDDKGNVIKKGGTSVYSNNNGDVNEVQFGNDPPPLKKTSSPQKTKDEPKVITKKPKNPKIIARKIKFPKAPVIKPHDLQNENTISSFTSTNTDGAGGFQSVFANSAGGGAFKSLFASSNTGGFSSTSSSSSSSFSNINGVKSGGGIASTHYNINGDSGGETIFYSTDS